MPFSTPEKRNEYMRARYAANREKTLAYLKDWRTKNPDKVKPQTKEYNREKIRKWRAANPEKAREQDAKANARRAARRNKGKPPKVISPPKTPAEKAEYGRLWRKENNEKYKQLKAAWKAANPDKVRMHRVNREMTKLKAIPGWANFEAIKEIYDRCRFMTEITGDQYHVDHIVPLRSPLVCGLHWELNLRVIPGLENAQKSNLYWPDMP